MPPWAVEVICGATIVDVGAALLAIQKRHEVLLKNAQSMLGEFVGTCVSTKLNSRTHVLDLIASYCGFPSYVSQQNIFCAASDDADPQTHTRHTVAYTGVHGIHGFRFLY